MDFEGGMFTFLSWLLLLFVPVLASCAGPGESSTPGGPEGPTPTVEIQALPGADPFPPPLQEQLAATLAARGPDYEPRTHHLRTDGSPKYTNRLILASSPYLIQHAHNPMNWFPWGDEAFETAARENRPVLLSVGYSTCHWCHVMEEESFEDEEIARFLNEHYVAIKVDREERPDVDAVYMASVQALTGRGGWPMTVWLTPDRQPFFGGTYFPARDGDRGARKGFLTLLRELEVFYRENPDRVTELGDQLTTAIHKSLQAGETGDLPGASVLETAVNLFHRNHDPVNGGLRGAPKFPSSLSVRLLLRHHRRTGNRESLQIAVLTLEKMAAGGIYDQVGGGFHRYSTDPRWLVPHFEKMLYDNALLVADYLEGYQVTGREDFARIARETLDYVLREMTSPEGGFFSATDADSEGEEGTFFLWSADGIREILGPEKGKAIIAYFGVTEGGNFEGRNILHTPFSVEEVASRLALGPPALRSVIAESRKKLYEVRSRRVPPFRDEKILTAWNGLMISALAQASRVLDEPRYARAAERAADFLLSRLRKDGRLLRSFHRGQARHNAYLDDYAFLIAALMDLYEATFQVRWLTEAIGLQEIQDRHFRDEQRGGYFQTSDDHETLLVREKPGYDGAVPSGNSIAVMNLLRLQEFTTDDRFRQLAEGTLRAAGKSLKSHPTTQSELLLALDYHLDQPKEIVIIKPSASADAGAFLAEMRKVFLPNRILAVAAEGADLEAQEKVIPLMNRKIAQGGKVTAYVCENRICALPTSDPDIFRKQITRVTPIEGGTGGS